MVEFETQLQVVKVLRRLLRALKGSNVTRATRMSEAAIGLLN
jgi:hypothetical protein